MEGGLSRSQEIDRVRRNTLKAASLVLGAVLATGALHKLASAAEAATAARSGNGTATATGRATATAATAGAAIALHRARKSDAGYRPIETPAAGGEVAVRFEASRRSRQWSVIP